MIIWKGYGILVLIVVVAALAVAQVVSQKITGDDQYYYQHGWVALTAYVFAAASIYGLHRLLLLKKDQVVIDKETGEEITLRQDHSLFFIPVKWWPAIIVILGLWRAADDSRAGAQPQPAANGAGQFAQNENANAR